MNSLFLFIYLQVLMNKIKLEEFAERAATSIVAATQHKPVVF